VSHLSSGEPPDEREQAADARLSAGEARDTIASARDLAAATRDQAAGVRDLAMAQLDAACEQDDDVEELTGSERLIRAAGQRKRAAARRAQAAEHRTLAARDRQVAAQDRELSARERRSALADREALARQVAISENDQLTGARARAAGMIDLDRELERCRRTDSQLAVAYVDVIGLQRVNDSEGHSAGDALLKRVVQLIRGHLRPYDLIVRVGGDEFLCAMPNTTLADARRRFSVMSRLPHDCAMRTGFAQLAPDDTVTELITRADGDLVGRDS
jgi:diguanylate cyclase (GGDEF)-like protein